MTTSHQSANTQQYQQQQTVSQPWAPAQPGLQTILSNLAGINQAPTGNQTGAVQNLITAAGNIPNLGPTITNASGNLTNNAPNVNDFLGGNYAALQKNLSGFLDPNFANGSKNPQLQQVLDTVKNDVTNQVNGQFAGAGRDLSPANTQALARGLAQGEAVPYLNEYNTLLGLQGNAASTLANAGVQTAEGYGRNALAGGTLAGMVPGLTTAGPSAQFGAANAQYSLPIANTAGVAGLTVPIAGLGGQVNSQGSSNSTTNSSYTPSLMSSIMAPFQGGQNSAFTGMTGYSSGMGGLQALGSAFGPLFAF